MAQRFDYGDRVEVNGHFGKIKSIWFNMSGDRIARVEFEDRNLIPPEMEVPENHLKMAPKKSSYYGDFYDDVYEKKIKYGPIDKVCPNCGDNWHITKFNNHIWKDCKRCKKKYEDLI